MQSTVERLAEFKKRIPANELAPVVRDAIYITKKLGLRFVRVDALCIIQNSPEDKRKEIKRMHTIFQNSTLMISASTADGNDARIFETVLVGHLHGLS
jgi:hypothetical protein